MGTEYYLIIALGAIILCLLSNKIKQLFAYFFWETVIVGTIEQIDDQKMVKVDLDDEDTISYCCVKIKDIFSEKFFRINIHSNNMLQKIKEKNGEIISLSVKKAPLSLSRYDATSLN